MNVGVTACMYDYRRKLSECVYLQVFGTFPPAWASEVQLELIVLFVVQCVVYNDMFTYFMTIKAECVRLTATQCAPSLGILCPVDALHCCGYHTGFLWGFHHHIAHYYLQSTEVINFS